MRAHCSCQEVFIKLTEIVNDFLLSIFFKYFNKINSMRQLEEGSGGLTYRAGGARGAGHEEEEGGEVARLREELGRAQKDRAAAIEHIAQLQHQLASARVIIIING